MQAAITFGEFKRRLIDEFSCDFKELTVIVNNSEWKVGYFEREFVSGEVINCPADIGDDEFLLPSQLRHFCNRLKIPPEHFGLLLG